MRVRISSSSVYSAIHRKVLKCFWSRKAVIVRKGSINHSILRLCLLPRDMVQGLMKARPRFYFFGFVAFFFLCFLGGAIGSFEGVVSSGRVRFARVRVVIGEFSVTGFDMGVGAS